MAIVAYSGSSNKERGRYPFLMNPRAVTATRTYLVETHGCQMNVHDSERIGGLLEAEGYLPATRGSEPDLVVFNTCAVRENADQKLYGALTRYIYTKDERPNFQIAVGGCLAQKDRGEIIKKAPWVDVVYGTHNVGALPALLKRAQIERAAQVEIKESLEHFPSTLPVRRDSAFSAWVSVSVGCNNTCTFCIVPALRGVEKDRPEAEILTEIRALVAQGVVEITLLGQNVNAYGVDFGDRQAFAKLLRACGEVDGLRRVRFMSPHPRDFTDDVIEAMAETPNVMPHLHMPLQSGSDSILQAMRRSYRSDRYLGILDRVRSAIPHAAITTDVIVGFPGESEDDFHATLEVMAKARFTAAYTFQYSKRPGTPAATMENQVDSEVIGRRYTELHQFQERISLEENQKLIGQEVEVLIGDHVGRRDAERGRVAGRSTDFRLVHLNFESENRPMPGDLVRTVITEAAPHHLIAAGMPLAIEQTPGSAAAVERTHAISLGMPTFRSANSPA
jgi:tRNA-2-methylthio-N6-dimethylallyladenosine synthase